MTVFAAREAVNADVTRFCVFPAISVEALEKSAVEKWDVFEKIEGGVGIPKQLAVTIEAVRHEVLFLFCPAAFVHFGVECSEEKILQDGLVENGFVVVDFRWLKAFESLGKVTLTKKAIGDQSLFLHEPAKHEARDEANNRNVILAILFGRVFGKFRVVQCPEIPVGDFLEEPLVEFGAVERLLPRSLKCNEVAEAVLFVERIEAKIEKDFDMGAMRIYKADVLNERDLFQHVL